MLPVYNDEKDTYTFYIVYTYILTFTTTKNLVVVVEVGAAPNNQKSLSTYGNFIYIYKIRFEIYTLLVSVPKTEKFNKVGIACMMTKQKTCIHACTQERLLTEVLTLLCMAWRHRIQEIPHKYGLIIRTTDYLEVIELQSKHITTVFLYR